MISVVIPALNEQDSIAATVAVTSDSDVAFERVAGVRLTKAERADRAERLAERGLVAEVERELRLLAKAPGAAPPRSVLVRARAFAHYRTRESYAQAAQLFEKASRLERGGNASDLFKAASAWSRSASSWARSPATGRCC